MDFQALERNYRPSSTASKNQNKQPQNRGNFLTGLIPTGGGIAGAAAGAGIGTAIAPGIGTILGALLGGAVGGGGGKAIENSVEGKNLLEGVPQEAALSGVLGAGPLRLGKAAIDVGRGLKAGQGVSRALSTAGKNATEQSVKGTIGGKLTNVSNDMAVKNFRLTPSQLNNFKGKFGEDASQVIKRYGLVGKDASTITEKAIKPLQGEFDTIATQVPVVPTADVLKAFKAKYNPLLKSAVEDNQSVGQQLKQQADAIAKKYGAEIPAAELNSLRQEFDSLVSYADKSANPARYGVNKRSADALRVTMQQAADNAGLKSSNGSTFKQVGQELSKLHQLTENIGKQEQLGRGSLPLGITTLLGGIGGGAGGIGGGLGAAAIGAGATKLANSSIGRRALASGTEKLGNRFTQQAAAAKPFGVKALTGRLAPLGIAQGIQSSSNQPMDSNDPSMSSPMSNPNNSPDSMDGSYNSPLGSANNLEGALMQSQQQSPYSRENLLGDIQRDPGNAEKYIAYYSALDKIFGSAPAKPIKKTETQRARDEASQLTDQALQQLQRGGVQTGPIAAPLENFKSVFNAGDQPTIDFNVTIDSLKAAIAKARAGTSFTPNEEALLNRYAPKSGDSQQQLMTKLSNLQEVYRQAAEREYGSGSGGAQPGTLEEALM